MYSVVIPLFNKANTIERALQSVLNQTFQQFEIIIVNDGSSDNSVAKATEIHDERIRIIHQENQGVSVARNTGIENATYNWIAFLDADDEWLPEFLEAVTNLHTKYPECNVLSTSYYLCNSKGEKRNIKLKRIKFLGEDGIMENYFEVATYSSPPLWTSAIAVKKKALQEIGGFPIGIKSGEDLLTWARLAVKNKIAYCITPHAVYNIGNYDLHPRIPEEFDYVGIELKKMNIHNYRIKKIYISNWHKIRARRSIYHNNLPLSFNEINKAIKLNPFSLKLYIYLLLIFFHIIKNKFIIICVTFLL